jgi:hypothetical protein
MEHRLRNSLPSKIFKHQQIIWAFWDAVTDRHGRGRVAQIEREMYANVLRFGIVQDWHAGVCFTLEVTEYFIHQLSGLSL